MIGVWELWGNVKKFEHRFGPEAPVCSAWTLLSHLFFSSVISINFQWIRREQPSLSRNYLFFFFTYLGILNFAILHLIRALQTPPPSLLFTPAPLLWPCTVILQEHFCRHTSWLREVQKLPPCPSFLAVTTKSVWKLMWCLTANQVLQLKYCIPERF